MPVSRLFQFLALLPVLLMPAAILCAPASAQITKTARIELSDSQDKIPLGSDLYITEDTDGRLNEQIIANRHENNLRGARQESEVINLGLNPAPVWMVFSVTNNSSQEDWILHFGEPLEGRLSFVHKLMVKNQTRDEIFAQALREKGKEGSFGEKLQGAALPVRIGLGKTELFIIYLEPEGSLPSTFAPSLMTQQRAMHASGLTDFFTKGLLFFLTGAAAFFGAAAYLEKTPRMALFSAYYAGHIIFFLLIQSLFFISWPIAGEFAVLAFPACFLLGLAMTWAFLGVTAEDYSDNAMVLSLGSFVVVSALIALVLPHDRSVFDDLLVFLPSTLGMGALAVLSFMHAQRGKFADYFLSCGWAAGFIGMLFTIMASAGIGGSALLLNGYWIALIPQALLFGAGMSKKIEFKREEERAALSRENRAAQSLARLKQSKETADQARLLRVIERERELMAELREQEMQRTEEMRRAKEMADQANRAKSAFLAVVSHEIRTPMTGVMGILRLLKDTKMSKEQSEYMLTIQKSCDTMMALLNDILDFEKIESGSMQLEEIDFDLPKLVQGVVTLMSGHAADRNVTLKADITDDFPAMLKGDPTRLRQILLNLVNNAIKFTENGNVTIRLRAVKLDRKQTGVKGDYEIYFGVEDTGIGISESAQARLFTPFEQADSSVSRKYGGTGLGLAICQKLVAAMGGSIGVNSQVGVGSTFFFSLLMKLGAGEAGQDAEKPVPGPTLSIPPMRILVIEDNEINRKVLRTMLEKEGHSVALADSGEQGLEIFSAERFDAVFTDINLSGMNGMDVSRTIRAMADRKIAATPIIALTGNVAEEDVQSFYKAGINGFIPKPIDYDRLLGMLADIHHHNPPAPPPSQRAEPKARPEPRPEPKSESKPAPQPVTRRTEPAAPSKAEARENLRGKKEDTDIAPIHKFLQEQEEKAAANKSHQTPQSPVSPVPGGDVEVLEMEPVMQPIQPSPPLDFSTLFDLKMLDGLLRSLGRDQMKELLDGFIEKTDEIVTALQSAGPAGDTQTVYERAHELKGMAANFGMKDLAKIAGQIEKAAKNGAVSADEIAKMPEAAEKTKAAIRAWLQ